MFKSVAVGISLISCLVTPYHDSYIIEIPNIITIDEQGQFPITLKQNNLSDNQTLTITFPKEFTLKDKHGKNDIIGTIENTEISFSNSSSTSNVSYSLNDIPVGEWTGQIPMTIDLSTSVSSNVLINGSEINSLLTLIDPDTITFSHDNYDYEDAYDISAKKDNSITLYDTGTGEVIISNHMDQPIIGDNLSGLFKDLSSLETINNLDYLDTSSCEDLSYFLYHCEELSTITGLENINISNVKNLSHFFEGCLSLRKIDLSSWDTSNVTDISYFLAADSEDEDVYNTFSKCTGINNLDLGNVKDASYLFYNCQYLNISDISQLQLIHIENMDYMFYNARLINISNLDNWANIWLTKPSMINTFSNSSGAKYGKTKPNWYQ